MKFFLKRSRFPNLDIQIQNPYKFLERRLFLRIMLLYKTRKNIILLTLTVIDIVSVLTHQVYKKG